MALTSRKMKTLNQKIRNQMVQLHKNPESLSIVEKFHWLCLAKYGAHGFKNLASLFQKLDKSGDNKIDEKEFVSGIQSLYLDKLSKREIKLLFKELDTDSSGAISIKEFNDKIIAQFLPEKRRNEVEKLFSKIDYDKSGFVDKSDLMKKLDFSRNEKFVSGQMSKEECIDNFISDFESKNGNNDGKISMEEFLAYYAGISLAVDDDNYFLLELQKNWKTLSTVSERQRSWPLSESFALDLSKTHSSTIRPSPHKRVDISPLSSQVLTDRKAQSARTLKSYELRETNPGTLGKPKATVVSGCKRSLYRSVAPSYVDRHLFGKPRNQQLMESDWPKFESPFIPKTCEQEPKQGQKSRETTSPLKWSPGATFDWSNTLEENSDDIDKPKKFPEAIRGRNNCRLRAKSAFEPYRTHKIDLIMPEYPNFMCFSTLAN